MFLGKQLVHNSGQSLIEVLVALSLAVLAISALVSVTMTSVKNAQFSKNQIQAEKYAQEGMEWVRLQKEKNTWAVFSDTTVKTFCINSLPTDWITKNIGLCGASIITGTIFSRELDLSQTTGCPPSTPNPINVKVTVKWKDSKDHQTVRETCFTNWEKK